MPEFFVEIEKTQPTKDKISIDILELLWNNYPIGELPEKSEFRGGKCDDPL